MKTKRKILALSLVLTLILTQFTFTPQIVSADADIFVYQTNTPIPYTLDAGNGYWFNFIPTVSATYTIAINSGFETISAYLFNYNKTNYTLVSYNNDGDYDNFSISYPVIAGQVYSVLISSRRGSTGTFTISGGELASAAIQFSQTNLSAGEGDGSTDFTVQRIGDTTGTATVDYSVTGGTAANGTDYTLESGTLNFASGQTSETIPVTLYDNSVYEGDKTVIVSLGNPTGSATLGTNKVATLTITDNESPGTLQFNPSSITVGEEDGNASVTVTRTGGSDGSVSVDYSTTNATATAGADYTTTSGTLTFGNGETTKTITIPILEDIISEGNETFTLSLSNPTGGASLGTASTATITITDVYQPGTLQFNPSSVSVGEEDGTASVTVTRTGGSDGSVSVGYSTTNATATAGVDYTATIGSLTFGNGETTKTITIPILEDSILEGNETFTLSLSNPTSGATLGSSTTATITITDNDNVITPVNPLLTPGSVTRTSDTNATVTFTSDKSGEYFYVVVEDGSVEPAIPTTVSGAACTMGAITITNPIGLTSGAKDIYIKVKDNAGNISDALKMDIPSYRRLSNGSNSGSNTNTTPQEVVKGNAYAKDTTDSAGTFDVIRTYGSDNQYIDTLQLTQSITNRLMRTIFTNNPEVTKVDFNYFNKEIAAALYITVDQASINTFYDKGTSLDINTDLMKLSLSNDSLRAVSDTGKDFHFYITMIQGMVNQDIVLDSIVYYNHLNEETKDKTIKLVGSPMYIQTEDKNLDTKLTLSLKDITLPEDETLREEFLDNLAVYHSNNEAPDEFIYGTVVFDNEGTPIGYEVELKHSGLVSLIEMN